VKIYLAKQDAFEVPSVEELAKMDQEIILLKEQLNQSSEVHKSLQAELKGVESALSDEQLQLQTAEFKTTSDALEQKLKSLKNPEPGAPPPVSAEQMISIEKSLAKYLTEWKKRKRICYDVLNKFSEQNGKKVRVIGEEIGIEFDEDVGAVLSPTPTVSAASKSTPSSLLGRVYPPVSNTKPAIPSKVVSTVAPVKAAITSLKSAPVASKSPCVASAKSSTMNQAVAKPASQPAPASKKNVKGNSDSDSDSDSEFSGSDSSSPKAQKRKPAAKSKAAPAAPKGKAIAAKPVATKALATRKKAARGKAKKDTESESSFSSEESESSDSDSAPIIISKTTRAAAKTPRAAAAASVKTTSKKSKGNSSDSDFEG
jgi:hypothetical protein